MAVNGSRTVSNWWKHLPFEIAWREYPAVDREFVVLYPTELEPISPAHIWAKRPICCYVGIPFCNSACDFCFFAKYVASDEERAAYVAALKKEIDMYAAMPYVQGCEVVSLYFGGGTPSVLTAAQLGELIDHLRARLSFAQDAEIEVEFHPLTADPAKLAFLRSKGVARVSFGIQSFNDERLHSLGAPHQRKDGIRAVELAREAGFPKVGFDLMYNKPNETREEWNKDVETAIALEPSSISFYGFAVVPRTPLFKRAAQSNSWIPVQPMDVMFEMWRDATERCVSAGYEQYACTCFGRPGGESRYLLGNWKAPQLDVLGLGAGATSSGINGHVYVNIHGLRDYLAAVNAGRLPVLMGKRIDAAEAMSRYPALGVRAMEVSKVTFRELFGFEMDDLYAPVLDYLRERELIIDDDRTMRLTAPRGTWYSNNVCKSFFTANNVKRPQLLHNELVDIPVPKVA
jgi:putative oxygen-independent coproporphyrinogen III oxidase